MASAMMMTKTTKHEDTKKEEEQHECEVCYEKYNNGTRSAIKCEFGDCNYNACKTCIRVYLMSTTTDPNCMQCHKRWSDKFIVKNLNASFMNKEYKIHRKELMTQQQISRLPDTMAAAEQYKNIKMLREQIEERYREERILWREIAEVRKNIHHEKQMRVATLNAPESLETDAVLVKYAEAYYQYEESVRKNPSGCVKTYKKNLQDIGAFYTYRTQKKVTDEEEQKKIKIMMDYLKNYESKRLEQELKLKNLTDRSAMTRQDINAFMHNIRVLETGGNIDGEGEAKESRKFIMPCSNADCRGYLSTHYKCNLCDFHTCSKCFELIGLSKEESGHECKEENIASAEFIKKQSKPCPCCGTRISKIDGCDQMWCTQCHKAFSWNTGKIVTGVIHNPHFYQYQRENGGGVAPRNAGDVECGGLCDMVLLNRELIKKIVATKKTTGTREEYEKQHSEQTLLRQKVMSLHRAVSHLIHTEINEVRLRITANEDYEKERVQYILKEISKEEMSSKIMRKDNVRKKNIEFMQLYEVITAVGIDMFRAILNSEKKDDLFEQEVRERLQEYDNLRIYVNNQFKEISMTYGICVPLLDDAWSVYNRKTIKYNLKGETDNYIIKREEEKVRRVKEHEKEMAERIAARQKKLDEVLALRKAQEEAELHEQAQAKATAAQAARAATAQAQATAEEEMEDVEAVEFQHAGKKYYRTEDDLLYDENTHELVGHWNKETQQIIIM